MTWDCYYICKNPEVQQKLHEEIDDLFSQFPTEIPSYDHFNNLKYTTNVIKETMRIVIIFNFNFIYYLYKVIILNFRLNNNTI